MFHEISIGKNPLEIFLREKNIIDPKVFEMHPADYKYVHKHSWTSKFYLQFLNELKESA